MPLHLAGDLLFALDAVLELDRRPREDDRLELGIFLFRQQGDPLALRLDALRACDLYVAVVCVVCRRSLNGRLFRSAFDDGNILRGALGDGSLLGGRFLNSGLLGGRFLGGGSILGRGGRLLFSGDLFGRFLNRKLLGRRLFRGALGRLLFRDNAEHHPFVFAQLAFFFMENLTG